jgi:hypothetical protein
MARQGETMLSSVEQDGLKMTVTPGFSWDSEQKVFKGPVLYGDEILVLCVTRERMQRLLNSCLDGDEDIEPLFHPETWITDAEHEHDREVFFEEDDELGPDN